MFSKQPIPPRRVLFVSSTGRAASQVTERCPVTKKGGAARPRPDFPAPVDQGG
jgi:hypothetical protein